MTNDFDSDVQSDIEATKVKTDLFWSILEKQDFAGQVEMEQDDEGCLTLSEPANLPSFYNAKEVITIAEICDLSALVTVSDDDEPCVIIRIF